MSTLGSHSPLISVITPAYNHGRYIEGTIKSVIEQTYPNIEYIIIDDGSPDDTAERIEKSSEACRTRFSEFTFIKQQNSGIIKTLNRAISRAKGEYLFFIASDDLAAPDTVSKLYNFLSANPDYGLVVPDNKIVDSNGAPCLWNQIQQKVYSSAGQANIDTTFDTVAKYHQHHRPDFNFLSDDFGTYRTLLGGNYFPVGPMIRKKTLDDIGGFSEKAPLEDYFLMLQIAKRSKIRFLGEPLISYRWHDKNTVRNAALMLKMTYETMLLEKTFCKQSGFARRWYNLQAEFLLRLIRQRPKAILSFGWQEIDVLLFGGPPVVTKLLKRRLYRKALPYA